MKGALEMKKPLIVANWKMNKTDIWTKKFFSDFLPLTADVQDREIAIAPPFTSLVTAKALTAETEIKLCAQNMHWELEGAYTGEISSKMLDDIGCTYVILGHSERREHFGDTDERVQKKVHAALVSDLVPILCVGEKEFERDSNRTFLVIEKQVRKALDGKKLAHNNSLVIAYEPVWAIGTGKTAKPGQANEVHAFIRELMSHICEKSISTGMRIIYGGSVSPDNIDALMSMDEIDGVLVGASSLDPGKFARIVKFTVE